VSLVGQAEFYYEKLITHHEVQLVEGDSEAGAFTRLGNGRLAIGCLKKFIGPRRGEASFESRCSGVLIELMIFKAFHMKFEKIRFIAWLKFILYMFGAAEVFVRNGLSLGSRGVEGVISVSSCNEGMFLCLNVECKKGVNFESFAPIINKNLIRLSQYYKQPTMSSAKSSVFSLGFSKSNIPQYIDQRQGCIGSGAPSPSRMVSFTGIMSSC
jgi:hypothetical protein